MRRKQIFLLLLVIMIFTSNQVLANEIKSIDLEVEILSDGRGRVTQYWDAVADEGTEFYIPIQKLNHMEIEDFKVSVNGRDYTFEEEWDVDRNLEEKAYKNGFYNGDSGLELCFGMSSHGENTYKIEYTFKNMVQSFSDNDGFLVRFINDSMDPTPDQISYRIYSNDIKFTEENSKIWAFGYNGNIKFVDGEIHGTNTDEFSSDNHATVLVEIKKGLLNPTYLGDGKFSDLKKRAFEGSSYKPGDSEYENSNFEAKPEPFPVMALFSVVGGLLAFGSIAVIAAINDSKEIANLPVNKIVDSSKEIALGGDIFLAYYFLHSANSEDEKLIGNMFTAILTKWINEGILSKELVKQREPNFVKGTCEFKLWKFLIDDKIFEDNKLDLDKLEKTLESKYYILSSIIVEGLEEGFKKALDQGLVEHVKHGPFIKKYELTDKGQEAFRGLMAYKNYLQNEVVGSGLLDKIDKDNIVFIILFGLKDEFKLNFAEKPVGDFYDDGVGYFPYYHMLYTSSRVNNSVSSGIKTYNDSFGTGAGGGASFGGGGGFSGGGSGGGAR